MIVLSKTVGSTGVLGRNYQDIRIEFANQFPVTIYLTY